MMRSIIKNKKGASLSNWIEVAVGLSVFVLILAIVMVNFNVTYNKNYDSTFGLDPNGTLTDLKGYQSTLQQSTTEGEASTNTFTGLSLSTTWGMIKAGMTIMWGFITGSWVEKSVSMAKLPVELGLGLRILYIISIGLIAIKLLLKVKA